MRYELRRFFESISKGEIIIACVFFVVWTTICIFINMAISNATAKSNEAYYKAIQIDNDAELFEYATRTDAGNALVYGTASCVDPVSDPKLKGEYLAIKVDIDRYERKVRYEDVRDESGNVVDKKAVYYKEWCSYKTTSSHASTVTFLGKEFPYDKLQLSNYSYINLNSSTVQSEFVSDIKMNYIYPDGSFSPDVGDLRYSYAVVPLEQYITIFADLREGTIDNVNYDNGSVKIYYNTTIDKVMQDIVDSKSVPNIIFCIFWYIAFIGICYAFVIQRNKWADC